MLCWCEQKLPISRNLMRLDAWPIGNSTIRMCGVTGVGVAMLEGVCQVGGH